MRYSNIRSWSLDNSRSPDTTPIDFYLDLTDEVKQAPSLEQAIRQAANSLNRLLFPMFQFKVDIQAPSVKKTRHIVVDHSECQALMGAQEDRNGNKNGYISCFIGGGWRGDWKTHNVDSIIHELLHTIGRNHEQVHPDSFGMIEYFNSPTKLPSENFLEYYDPWSPMHYSLELIRVVMGGGRVAPKTTVMESLTNQGYPHKLALDYYEALLGLNENSDNFDAFNLGFGLLTQRDFHTLHKTARIIDPKMHALTQPTPLFAFTTNNNKISYRYLLKLTKIFVNPWYQKQKLIVVADTKELEINSSHCYIVDLKSLFQVSPNERNIHCEIITSVLQERNGTQFSGFPRKEGDSCTLMIGKGFLDLWHSSIQCRITFYPVDQPSANSSSTLQLLHPNTQSNTTYIESSLCLSVPNGEPFNRIDNTTWIPFFNSETVPGSNLYFYERNKFFSRLVLNTVPFFVAGLVTGLSKRAEGFVSSYFNENPFNASGYWKRLPQLIQLVIHTGLTSYAMHQHITEDKARQLLIPLLDENRQLFQTADLMDRLNSDEFLPLALPYAVNLSALLASIFIKPIRHHWITRIGLTNALTILTACIANQGNSYSYLELAIGISVYIGGTLIGYCLTGCSLSLLLKLKTHLPFSQLKVIEDTSAKNSHREIRVSLIEEDQANRDSSPKETLSVAEAIRHAWNSVSLSRFTTALLHSSFFTYCRSSEYQTIGLENHSQIRLIHVAKIQ